MNKKNSQKKGNSRFGGGGKMGNLFKPPVLTPKKDNQSNGWITVKNTSMSKATYGSEVFRGHIPNNDSLDRLEVAATKEK